MYTPTAEDIAFAKTHTDSVSGRFRLLVQLKVFQRLGYFPHPDLIPATVINHIRSHLKIPTLVSALAPLRTHRRYQQAIRTYLGVKPYSAEALKVAASAIAQAAEGMEHPADLINVGIQTLVKERYELPAFSTLDRKACNIRSIVNTRLFQRVSAGLSPTEQTFLEQLLKPETPETEATLQLLKAPPKSARLSHMQELQTKFDRSK